MTVTIVAKTTRISTYGELVTSVINPSHKISKNYSDGPVESDGQSLMRNYNDVMTVAELTDIVAFCRRSMSCKP